MFIIRTVFWLGIVIMLLPSDKAAQSRMAAAAENTYRQVSTMCDRHQAACEQGAAAWVVFKAKAQVVGRMAFDLAMDRLAPQTATPADVTPSKPGAEPVVAHTPGAAGKGTPERAPVRQQGTLRDDDMAPRWRADVNRGRI